MLKTTFSISKQIALSVSVRNFGIVHQIPRSFNTATSFDRRSMLKQSTNDLRTRFKNFVTSFQMVPDLMARYKQLLLFASKLDPLTSEFHAEKHRAHGCVSGGWTKLPLHDGAVQFRADSDAQLTKKVTALLLQGSSGCSLHEVLMIQPDLIEMHGLKQNLTSPRNKGFTSMLKLIRKRTLESAAMGFRSQDSNTRSPSSDGGSGNGGGPPIKTPVEDSIREKIIEGLNPEQLLIINESSKHAGHIGNPNNDPETHFKLDIVASKFEGVNSVKRHRMVYTLLQEELAGPVHALALNTRTPTEPK